MAVAFVVVLVMFVVMLALFVVVLIVMLALFVVVLFLMLWHDQVVSTGIAVEFLTVFGVLSQMMNIRRVRTVQVATQLIDEECFKVEGFHAGRHGVRCGRKGCVCSHGVEGFVDPWLEPKPVIEEHIRGLQADQVLSRWFVVMDRNIARTHHFNVDQIASNGGHDLFNVIG